MAGATCVRIFDGQTELARHRRSYDTGQIIEAPEHLEGSSPPPPRPTHTPPATAFASPSSPPPRFDRVAERGEPLRPHATRLLALLDDYGPQELAAALERDALGAGFIAHILETRRRKRGLSRPSGSPCPPGPDCVTRPPLP